MSTPSLTSPPSFVRHAERYDHITIGLFVQVKNGWEAIRAHEWSSRGFQFFTYIEDLPAELTLKRNGIIFPGTVMWHARNTYEPLIVVSHVNELLYKQAQFAAEDETLHTRLLRLIRTPWMVKEKIQVLSTLGVSLTKPEMEQLLTKRMTENAGFRYGVKVDTEEWTRVTSEAASLSSIVSAFEQYSNSFGSKQ